MRKKLLGGALSFGMLVAPALFAEDKPKPHNNMKPAVSSDMQRAIAWERFKDQAAARQARKEAIHPSVQEPSANSANRSMDEKEGNTVRDPGPAPSSKIKK